MKPIAVPERVRRMDREAIEAGTPGIVLMQRAAAALAKAIEHRAPGRDIVLLCCGGNNGGDGFAAANLLLKAGFAPKIVLYADPENLRGDAAIAYSNLESAVPAPDRQLSLPGLWRKTYQHLPRPTELRPPYRAGFRQQP